VANLLPQNYPQTPPAWIGSWPDRRAIEEMFTEGVRRYAARAARLARSLHIEWTATSLILRLDAQRAEWRCVKGRWMLRCSCGFPGGCCAHAYIAAVVFRRICEKENWLFAGGAPAPPAPESDSLRTPARRTGLKMRQADLPLFDAQAPSVRTPGRIEVEADFHHDPGRVTIRVYLRREKEGRTLLRMQQLWNLACQCADGSPLVTAMDRTSKEFLAWLRGRLVGRREVRTNLKVLKLKPAEFRFWLSTWGRTPGLFIERATQEPIEPPGESAAVRFEVRVVDGGDVLVDAMACYPDGRRQSLSALLSILAGGRSDVLPDGLGPDGELPIPRAELWRRFGKGPVRVPLERVESELPRLLHGRLDLLDGPGLERTRRRGRLTVAARAVGDRIEVRLAVSGCPLRDLRKGAADRVSLRKNRIVLETYFAPEAEDVMQRLLALPVKEGNDVWTLPCDAEGISVLAEFWRALPDGVKRRADPCLKPALDGTTTVRPVLRVQATQRVVAVALMWAVDNGEVTVSGDEIQRALRRRQRYVRSTTGHWFELAAGAAGEVMARCSELGLDPFGVRRLLMPEAREVLRRVDPQWLSGDEQARSMVERVCMEPAEPLCEPSDRMRSILRSYQVEGVAFLADRIRYRVGAVLADDMGLGKTLQVLTLLEAWFRNTKTAPDAETSPGDGGEAPRRGALVVCPASVMSVWEDEARRFFSDTLRCVPYRGRPDERRRVLENGDWDVLVANFALLRNDAETFRRYTFEFIVVDEAQNVKNPDAMVSRVVRSLRTPRPIALTGTPLENRMTDLWSIMEFVNPGYLGALERFVRETADERGRRRVRDRIAPVLLRRTKEQVAPELPPRTEEILRVEMTAEQEALYRRVLEEARRVAAEGSLMHVFAALTRLRQVCCHPALLSKEAEKVGSAKFDLLMDRLQVTLAEGHAALVFSQFTSMLDIIARSLDEQGLPYLMITGDTPVQKRQAIVEQFQQADEPRVLLLSLRAAGTGLNLTGADYVFLYDPWWNPAVEAQAVDRAHRIGQERPVFAYRLIIRDAVEERVLELQREKAELFRTVVDAAGQGPPVPLTEDDVRFLIS